jgi:hypothetical protein
MRAGTQIKETVEPMIAKSPQFDPHSDRTPASTVPPALRVPAIILRALFLGALIVIHRSRQPHMIFSMQASAKTFQRWRTKLSSTLSPPP